MSKVLLNKSIILGITSINNNRSKVRMEQIIHRVCNQGLQFGVIRMVQKPHKKLKYRCYST